MVSLDGGSCVFIRLGDVSPFVPTGSELAKNPQCPERSVVSRAAVTVIDGVRLLARSIHPLSLTSGLHRPFFQAGEGEY